MRLVDFGPPARKAGTPHTPMNSNPPRILLACLALAALPAARADNALGIFTDHGDIGTVSRPGSVTYDPVAGTYAVGASGANIWFKADAMQFVWKKASGDLSFAAAIAFVGQSTERHRKACLVIRQSLDAGSPYVDVAQHGDGLTSLQFRDIQGGITREIQSNLAHPSGVRLDKIGDTVYLSVAPEGQEPHPSGASFALHFSNPFYVGLAVSAHNDSAFETAVFSKVKIGSASGDAAAPQPGLTIITLPSGDRRVSGP
jgi:TolB protein